MAVLIIDTRKSPPRTLHHDKRAFVDAKATRSELGRDGALFFLGVVTDASFFAPALNYTGRKPSSVNDVIWRRRGGSLELGACSLTIL